MGEPVPVGAVPERLVVVGPVTIGTDFVVVVVAVLGPVTIGTDLVDVVVEMGAVPVDVLSGHGSDEVEDDIDQLGV